MIYVASSWRNPKQEEVVIELKAAGYDVYDFKNPSIKDKGFSWSDIDPDWLNWSRIEFLEGLEHPLAKSGFNHDMDALKAASSCLLVMPCGRSAHLELGHAAGAGKPVGILLSSGEPELMYKMADVLINMDAVMNWAARVEG